VAILTFRLTRLVLACLVIASTGCSSPQTKQSTGSTAASQDSGTPTIVIHDSRNGLLGVHAANPEMKLRADRDSATGEPVLVIDYAAANSDPAARDVFVDAATRDWTAGSAILIRIKPAHATRLSVSFLDRNHVAYTAWATLDNPIWQSIRVAFSEIKPNPYFQPPDAKRGARLDVSDVSRIGFAPQDPASGQLAISQIVVEK